MVAIRPAVVEDAEAIAAIHIASWRAQFIPFLTPKQVTLKNLVMDTQQRLWQARLTDQEGQTRHSYIAVDNGKPVGYITGRTDSHLGQYTNELDQIYVLASHMGRGVGTKLVVALVDKLLDVSEQGGLFVWVMTINPAVAFYRDRLGGQFIAERVIPHGDGILREAAYGWDDIKGLKRKLIVREDADR